MKPWAAIGLALSMLSACSTASPRIESHALGTVAGQSGDRYIIAAVDNDPTAFLARAGSTPHGYDSIAPYGATSRAQALMHSLAKDYRLREISDWPIEPLHMHCAVLQIPEGADRAALLATISADPRVRLAQPLQNFSTRSSEYNDPYVELQRGLRQMNVLETHPWPSWTPEPTSNTRTCAAESRRLTTSSMPMPSASVVIDTVRKWPGP
jgi:hypothetical protein